MINTVKDTCDNSTLLGTFLENHDNVRFPSLTSDMELAKNAIAFVILSDGIPIIYAGQEQHFSGGSDPDNREALWLSGYPTTTSPLYTHIQQLNQIRNQAIYKQPAYITYQNYPIYQDSSVIAMRKGYDGYQIITVLNNQGSDGTSYSFTLSGTGFSSGESVVEVLGCSIVEVDSNGDLTVAMSAGQANVYYPLAQLSNSGICDQ
jgi:alpha-amylase